MFRVARYWLLGLVILLAAASLALLPACGGEEEKEGSPTPKATAVGSPKATPTVAGSPTAAGALKIGALVPFTGSLSDFGVPFERSMKLAVKEINAAGGVLGKPVVLVSGDGATEPIKAQEEARRLIDIEKVSAIIGEAASGVTLPVAESVTVPAKILQISPASTSVALTVVEDDDYLFRTTINDLAQGGVMATLVDDLGYTSACTMYVNNAYGQGLSEAFTDAFGVLGGSVTAQVSHAAEEQVSYLSELNQCVEGNPEVLAAISYPEHGRVYLKEALEGGLIDNFVFCDGTMSPDMFKDLGWDSFEGMYGTSPGASDPARGQEFTAAYEAEYGEKPAMPFMRESYDAVYVIALAAEKAGSTDSTAIRDALRDVANPPGTKVTGGVDGFTEALDLIDAGTDINYSGAASEIDFDAAGDVPQGAIQVWKIEGGKIVESVRIFRVNLETGEFVEVTQ